MGGGGRAICACIQSHHASIRRVWRNIAFASFAIEVHHLLLLIISIVPSIGSLANFMHNLTKKVFSQLRDRLLPYPLYKKGMKKP